MPRWGPDADGRLYRSAMELIFERGYDGVTVAEIAEHAGMKKRSFFRHFADKREVLFAGSADFEQEIVASIRSAPSNARPVEATGAALAAAGSALAAWGDPVRHRQRIIAGSVELRERELIKLEALTAAVGDALRARGVHDVTATLVAQAGVAAFRTAFQAWAVEEQADASAFPLLMDDALARLRAEFTARAG